MDHLHSYWRMDYLEAPKMPAHRNPFRVLLQSTNDREALIVYRARHCCLMLNRYPYNAGHLLLLPLREVADLQDLSPEERSEMMEALVFGQDLLRHTLQPDGFNIGLNLHQAAGAGVPDHLHFHIVPRWQSDTNFMPVIAATSVLPTSLNSLWERLTKAIPEFKSSSTLRSSK